MPPRPCACRGIPRSSWTSRRSRTTITCSRVFRENGCWGAIARSNYSGLRFREPIHPTIRSLVLSYVESYFNLRRQKTLRRYSRPVNLSRFDAIHWMTSEEDLWEIPDYLAGIPHTRLLPARVETRLSPVDRRMFDAGLVGRRAAR